MNWLNGISDDMKVSMELLSFYCDTAHGYRSFDLIACAYVLLHVRFSGTGKLSLGREVEFFSNIFENEMRKLDSLGRRLM